jgi:hypothetical protein
MPLEISSRSESVNASLERRRAAGRIGESHAGCHLEIIRRRRLAKRSPNRLQRLPPVPAIPQLRFLRRSETSTICLAHHHTLRLFSPRLKCCVDRLRPPAETDIPQGRLLTDAVEKVFSGRRAKVRLSWRPLSCQARHRVAAPSSRRRLGRCAARFIRSQVLALFFGIGLLLSLSVLTLDQNIPGGWCRDVLARSFL